MKIMFKIFYFFFAISLVFQSCSSISADEVTRFSVDEFSLDENYKIFESEKISIEKNEKVFVWSKLDLEYEGDLDIGFQVQLFNSKDENLMLIEFNPLEPVMKVLCANVYVGDVGTYSCTGLSEFHLPEGDKNEKFRFLEIFDKGDYYFKAILYSKTNAVIKLKKAELIIKK